ncbi:zinc ribbon domain-containing protein [Mycolicibacterium tusciae]|uniref:Recombinase zinc beta ribbon domain-containing protein n=1 Tax=Mycolicibacterium tusciae TaxID=75922 RepID=A0A1X0JXP0_9MYCO|nr:zinc ribbon domain-containing protein [Mycolicibacterium tusciae]ORB66937.1 hypothetical protein BST47_07675 [Mycolicibacterium tusciae]
MASPLAGVAVCLVCELTLHHDRNTARGREYRYYRCQNRGNADHAGTANLPADWLEELAEEAFLDKLGDSEVRERVWVPGDS